MLARRMIVGMAVAVLVVMGFGVSAADGSNLVDDPNFEDPNTLEVFWLARHCLAEVNDCVDDPNDEYGYEVVDSNGYTGNCVKMQSYDANVFQATSQSVGVLEPGDVYEFSAKFKTSATHYGYINLYDGDWSEDPNGGDKSFTTDVLQGTDNWHAIKRLVRIPYEDGIGGSTGDDNFEVYLYAMYPVDDNSPIYYDNVVLREFDTNSIPTKYSEIEEQSDWYKLCQTFTGSQPFPLTECDVNMVSDYNDPCDANVSGEFALVLQGSKTTRNMYTINLAIKPSTKYKISAKMKYENRECYSYLALDPNYPMAKYKYTNKGVWCGRYMIWVSEPGRPAVGDFLQPLFGGLYVGDCNRDWYYEENYYESSPEAAELKIRIVLDGFDGKLYIDNLTVEEVKSHIEDKYLRIPIDYEFEGMKITEANETVPFVETNAAKFIFDNNSITLQKKDGNDVNTVGTIVFVDDPNFLANLDVNDQDVNGVVILDNNNITVSVGADSTMLVKLDANLAAEANVVVRGVDVSPKYYNFDAGIIFVTDYEKGLMFSPLYPPLNIAMMTYTYDSNIVDYIYDDDDFNDCGLVKNWTLDTNFSDSNWCVTYNFEGGEGFLVSVFPPKDFNDAKYAKERVRIDTLVVNWWPDGDFRYCIQKFKERENVGIVWGGRWDISDNPNAPTYYYVDACDPNVPVAPNDPNAQAVWFGHYDLGGPYHVADVNGLSRLAEQAHAQDVKIIVYMVPEWYYTSEPNVLLDNVKSVIDDCGIDGVYFDGTYYCRALRGLKLVRETRNLLGSGYYCQHETMANSVIKNTDRFREVFYDLYADRLWLGEHRRKDWGVSNANNDPNGWGMFYCNRNLGNTPSRLVSPYYRPVDYNDPNSADLTLEADEQIAYQLEYKGVFPVNNRYEAYIEDPVLKEKKYYDARELWYDPFDELCLEFTYADGVADVGETIYTAREDCAPTSAKGILTVNGNIYECTTDCSVAQWIIDGNQPYYRLHFTFDANIATEDSDNKMNPDLRIGLYDKYDPNTGAYSPDPHFAPPNSVEVDGRKAFYFDGAKKLFGEHDDTLCFTDDSNDTTSFSAFACIKRDSNSSNKEIVFTLRPDFYCFVDHYLYYGIEDSKLDVNVIDSNGSGQEFSGETVLGSGWHTIGIVYDSSGSSLKFYVDGLKDRNDVNIEVKEANEFGHYVIGALFYGDSTYNFKGWIDDLFVTDRALTDEQVLQYHQDLHKTLTISGASSVDCIITEDGQKYTAASSGIWNVTQDVNYATIQDALDDANNGDEILVFEGTYSEAVDFNGVSCTLRSRDVNDWGVVAATIIDANGGARALDVDTNSTISGLTITGGTYGVYCDSASPTIEKCIIEDNATTGVYCSGGGPEIINNKICDNGSYGIYSDGSSAEIKNNWIYGNDSEGIRLEVTGGMTPLVRSNTIAYNTNRGIYQTKGKAVTVSNCILWGNSDDLDAVSATYSCIQDNDSGTGNIHDNPLFIDGANDDYHLDMNSPCIDTGNPSEPNSSSDEADIDGEFRVVAVVDMGADETYYPVSWWKFDEDTGSTAHDSSRNNHGSVYGANWTTGQIDGALDFDGSGDYVDVGDQDELDFGTTTDFTLSAWFQTSSSSAQMIVNKKQVSTTPGYDVCVASGEIYARIGEDGEVPVVAVSSGEDFDDGSWHHMAVVFDRDDVITVYVDANDVATSASISGIDCDTGWEFFVGNRNGDSVYFNGKIDDVRVYNRALSDEEIEELYEEGSGG